MAINRLTALAAFAAISAFAAACGGGGGGGGTGSRITDPALVPTSTPIQQPLTFRSINDEIQVSAGGGSSTQGAASGPQTHTVAGGETCADIADQYGVTVDDLLRANRSINADCTNLGEGDNLRIPTTAPTPGAGSASGTPTPTGSDSTYTVQSGDTCTDIAANHGVSSDELISLNGLDPDCTSLHEGDVLQIP